MSADGFDPHRFDFDLDRGIRGQVVESLEKSPLPPLDKRIGPADSGIYALCHKTRASNEFSPSGLKGGESQAVSLAREQADDRQRVVVRHVIDRLSKMTAAFETSCRQWHESVEEATALRRQLAATNGQLAATNEQLTATSGQLQAITGSRGFKLLQLLYRIRRLLTPSRSSGGRLPAGRLRVGKEIPSQCPLAAAGGVNNAAILPPAATAECIVGGSNRESASDGQVEVPDLSYAPLRWHLRDTAPSDAEFIQLIILSPTHRSGSTLLQRICNARKGTLIWGEHGGLLKRFADIYMDAAYFSSAGSEEGRNYFGSGEDPNLWIASMCPAVEYVQQAVVDSARAFLGAFYGQYREHHDVLGFKEVTYGPADLELLRRCYPQAQFLFLVRNPLNTWRSTPRSWYLTLDEWTAKWNDGTLGFRAFAQRDAGSHLIRYEDLIRKESGTMAILAQAAKVSDQEVSKVLAHKLGSNDAGLSASEQNLILARCREPMEVLGYW